MVSLIDQVHRAAAESDPFGNVRPIQGGLFEQLTNTRDLGRGQFVVALVVFHGLVLLEHRQRRMRRVDCRTMAFLLGAALTIAIILWGEQMTAPQSHHNGNGDQRG